MPPTKDDLAKYARAADAYHDPVRGVSLRALAARYKTTPATISRWLHWVGRPPRPQGTHGPAEVRQFRRRLTTLERRARQAAQLVAEAKRKRSGARRAAEEARDA